jgi:hypothetical protein
MSQSLDDLPPTLSPVEAFRLLGLGRTKGYELLRSGEWPTRVIRLGAVIRIPTAPLVAILSETDRTPTQV